MTSVISNQFSAFSEDNDLNKHGDIPTKNITRKLKKKLRRSVEKYNKNPSLENQLEIEKYQKLIRIEEASNKSAPIKKKVEEKINESFDDILTEFNNKYKEIDQQSLIEKENLVKKLAQTELERKNRRIQYNEKKKDEAEKKAWINLVKENESIMNKIQTIDDMPFYVNMYIHDPNQYDGLKKFIKEHSIDISEEITSLIETIKIEHTTFLDNYTKSQKRHFRRKRKSPKRKI